MKKLKWLVAVVLALAVIAIEAGHGQDTETTPLSLTPADIASFASLTDAQLAAIIDELDAIPTVAATNFTEDVKGYYSLANPDWPPLPFNSSGSAAWPLTNGCALLNDINFDYQAAAATSTRSLRLRRVTGKPMGFRSVPQAVLDLPCRWPTPPTTC